MNAGNVNDSNAMAIHLHKLMQNNPNAFSPKQKELINAVITGLKDRGPNESLMKAILAARRALE